ncbi:CDP-alcohol phosphatidyltransferase family protein [Collimonas sp.]|jgi:CDP-diacylglycerol--glycerol-3-phosphate 3-phosphatidyltransferase|uniref:CDP-alcohol phosphatidyltransferase family protein n=1 Tax=Collimonas sp. TaxID=1963772 RepID=UPI002C2E2FE1|nr:CDP-alcohol phosphatidyltransferase family protein [Collimonas sp.]HWX00603.1 CDP-alcohol phosphatidyltransferase family protein [Collimonas sp.]
MTFSIYQLKPKFQQLLSPLLKGLVRLRVTPNQITVLALLLSMAYGVALALFPQCLGLWYGLPLFLLLRMGLNAIDGMLASATGQKTRLGALLNEMCDQVSDVALYLPFALLAGISAPLLVIVLMLALLAEFAGVLAATIGAPRRFDGPMGKSDRAFAFGLLALLSAAGAAPHWLNAVLLLILALSLWTVVNRLRQALRFSAPPTP